MRLSAFLLSVYFFTGLYAVLSAPVEAADDKCFDSVMVLLIKQRYDLADERISAILKKDPGNVDALYMRLTIMQTRLLDYESYTVESDEFLALADTIRIKLETALRTKSGRDSLAALFYLANVYGGKSLIYAKCGNWMLGVKDALTSVKMLTKVKENDSTFFAAYLGTGIFNYYLSQNLGWMPFVGDKSKEGLRDIRLATRARFPFNYAAKNTLAWILIERNDYRGADSVVNTVLADYPDNTIFLRIKVRISLWGQKEEPTIRNATRLAALSLARRPVNWSDALLAYQSLVETYERTGQYANARERAQNALGFDLHPDAYKIPYVVKHLAYLRAVEKKYGSGDGLW